MRRHLLNLLGVLSLALCAAAAFEWVRGGRAGDQITLLEERRVAGEYVNTLARIGSGRGRLSLVVRYERSLNPVTGGPTSVARHWRREPLHTVRTHFERRTFWQKIGFRYESEHKRAFVQPAFGGWPLHQVAVALRVPYWAIVLVTAAVPATVALARRRAKAARRRRGECAACGYDLRATPGRCPECGSPTSLEVGAARHGRS